MSFTKQKSCESVLPAVPAIIPGICAVVSAQSRFVSQEKPCFLSGQSDRIHRDRRQKRQTYYLPTQQSVAKDVKFVSFLNVENKPFSVRV